MTEILRHLRWVGAEFDESPELHPFLDLNPSLNVRGWYARLLPVSEIRKGKQQPFCIR